MSRMPNGDIRRWNLLLGVEKESTSQAMGALVVEVSSVRWSLQGRFLFDFGEAEEELSPPLVRVKNVRKVPVNRLERLLFVHTINLMVVEVLHDFKSRSKTGMHPRQPRPAV